MEILLQWVMNNWDYAGKGRAPRIGHNTWNIASGTYHQAGIDRMLQWYPDKFDWAGVQMAPTSQSAWASEIAKFKTCDYIIITTSGPMTTSFIKEARDRGYTGVFLGCNDSFPGYWDLIESAVPADKIGTCYLMAWYPWWSTDCAFTRGAKEAVMTYHASESAALLRSSGPMGGWLFGLITVDALKRAIETVGGAENLTGAAIRDAFMATNLTVDGYPRAFKFTDTDHAAVHEAIICKFDASLPEKWVQVGPWIRSRSAGA
ncbi:MAG: ABC transporter substrate-binding protein [Chloroflexi bacterium]|nr:ABC transporter substrate-binding protein [Chloroflexota bacterium]